MRVDDQMHHRLQHTGRRQLRNPIDLLKPRPAQQTAISFRSGTAASFATFRLVFPAARICVQNGDAGGARGSAATGLREPPSLRGNDGAETAILQASLTVGRVT